VSLTVEELRGLSVRRLMPGPRRTIIRNVTIAESDFERFKKREAQRRWRQAWLAKPGNAEKARAWSKDWIAKNKDKQRAAQRAWNLKHKEHVLAKSRAQKAREKNDPIKHAKLLAKKREAYARKKAQATAHRDDRQS
jgi:hypothetical protein